MYADQDRPMRSGGGGALSYLLTYIAPGGRGPRNNNASTAHGMPFCIKYRGWNVKMRAPSGHRGRDRGGGAPPGAAPRPFRDQLQIIRRTQTVK